MPPAARPTQRRRPQCRSRLGTPGTWGFMARRPTRTHHFPALCTARMTRPDCANLRHRAVLGTGPAWGRTSSGLPLDAHRPIGCSRWSRTSIETYSLRPSPARGRPMITCPYGPGRCSHARSPAGSRHGQRWSAAVRVAPEALDLGATTHRLPGLATRNLPSMRRCGAERTRIWPPESWKRGA